MLVFVVAVFYKCVTTILALTVVSEITPVQWTSVLLLGRGRVVPGDDPGLASLALRVTVERLTRRRVRGPRGRGRVDGVNPFRLFTPASAGAGGVSVGLPPERPRSVAHLRS